jgi:hypothetical protein
MAKKPTKAKLSIKAPSQPVLAPAARNEDEQYKIKDDADRIRRYAELRQDQDRHKKALDHINNEHRALRSIIGLAGSGSDAGEGTITPRSVARAGRRKSTRVPRSGSRR